MEHVVFLDRATLKANVRRPAFAHVWEEHGQTPEAEAIARLAKATIAITNKVPISRAALEQLPDLKMIAVAATGYNIIDIAACGEHGVAVANIRNYAVHTVPEHVFALILALKRNILAYHADIQRGRWQMHDQFCFFDHRIGDLHGSTLGIIGAGTLGRETARIAQAFRMRVLYVESLRGASADGDRIPLDQLLAESDIVSLHCPLTDATRNLLGERELRLMRSNALLINTARGGLVDEAVLARALTEGWIAGAGFDVLTQEPPKTGNPLLEIRTPNFILTPHIAWASDEAMQILADQLIANIEAFIAGKSQNLVT
ncbi:MAG: D-2-hydroxyacid dehydrogenase [Methylophilaceae bacterium]